ncbi:pentatricopeptide repeat-containing protein At1g80270, mitochondrial isoform X2 [Sesamum indicum]|uniref:Pentatricopeptide repeat-containing protein At1g80270, mitochondrial isoform X2 n=1 Tax=Sesamum indicum TaxID=4182 RepID=A0A6I9T4Z4_SESIN|nr:pentatricopeptide repeat-containing protein At1g80270, mitochondrial isoform X2 [Sesamum indicum]
MWAVRRASIHLRNRGLSSGTARVCCGKSEIARWCLENYNAGITKPQGKLCDGLLSSKRFYNTQSSCSKSQSEIRNFSSKAGARNSEQEDDDLEDGFSDLEKPSYVAQESTSGDESERDDDLISRSELSEEEDVAEDTQNELEVLGTETDVEEKKSPKISAMTKAILDAPASSVSTVLDKWVEEGNEVTQIEVSLTMFQLRIRRFFTKALQLSEWVESTRHLEFNEKNYASRLDLIAKVRGISKAEEYLKQIPKSFRGEIVYRTLLANYVSCTNVKKSEELFNKIKELEFPMSCFTYNQMLILYKRVDKKKIADVLLLMEKENIKPTIFTYQILIDVKGQSNDIIGMEQIVETLKAEGLEPNSKIQTSLARYYAIGGLKDKAEAILKEMEGGDIKKKRRVRYLLLPIYASLGWEDEVERIWKVCEPNPQVRECMAAIEAWGQLERIENAEAAFDKLLEKVKKPTSRHFAALMKVYTDNKILAKGKDLVKRMADSGLRVGPLACNAVVKLYVRAGEVERAVSILNKAIKQKTGRLLFSSYLTIMDKYADRGDIHSAEKIFLMMRQAGYTARLQQYQSLLHAYINAKAPAYGFSDRMKADNIFPNKALASQLARANAFRKSELTELLE